MSEVQKVIDLIKSSKVKGSSQLAVHVSDAILADAESYDDMTTLKKAVQEWGKEIIKSRATQFTLRTAVSNTLIMVEKVGDEDGEKVLELLRHNVMIYKDLVNTSGNKVSELGSNIIQKGDTILTNSYSTMVLKIIEGCILRKKDVTVCIAETRPRYQGIKMATQLVEKGIKTKIVVDAAVRHVMKDVDIALVGADAVSSDGSVISKIGSSLIALSAHEARIPFYVAAPTYKFSEDTLSGVMLKIEKGKPQDIINGTDLESICDNELLEVYNPSFDATPPEYIRGIITEKYVMSPFSVGEYLAKRSGLHTF